YTQHPMTRVLNSPMRAHRAPKLLPIDRHTAQVAADLGRLLITHFARRLDHPDASQITPRSFFKQMIRSLSLPISARLNPTVLAIGRLVRSNLIVPGPPFAHRSQKFR